MTEPIDPAITSKIVQALASYLKRDPASITESHHLRDDLGLDSVAIIELLFEIEERFKLQIPDQDLPGLSTVGTVAAYVQRRLGEPQSESAQPATAVGKSKSAKSTKAKTASAKSPTTKKGSSAKPASAGKPKKASAGTSSGKKKVATR